jgi:hypothetical protein
MALNFSIFFYRRDDHDSALELAMQAFKYAVSDLNLSKESAHIVERLQKLLSNVITELIDQKEDKIMDLKDECNALRQDLALAQAWTSLSTLEALEIS